MVGERQEGRANRAGNAGLERIAGYGAPGSTDAELRPTHLMSRSDVSYQSKISHSAIENFPNRWLENWNMTDFCKSSPGRTSLVSGMGAFSLENLEAAAKVVHETVAPTPQIHWPLLCLRAGTEVWVKHENHTPLGAFKLRGGLIYVDELQKREPSVSGLVAATRGNHGQSIAFAGSRAGLRVVLVVPHGNSKEKNAAMRVLGAELIEHGRDFQDAYEHATELAEKQNLHLVKSFDLSLVRGVASFALELFRAVSAVDTVYVPIGLGSGICGTIAVRDALGLNTEVVGVVAAKAKAYSLSLAAGQPIASEVGETIADGMACRVPDPKALEIIQKGVSRIVIVSEREIRAAMRYLFADTHNAAEGAGAASTAALLQERSRMRGRRVAVVLSGGNIDSDLFARTILSS